MSYELSAKIKELALPCLANAGLVFFDIKLWRSGKNFNVCILADYPDGGITLEECAAINGQIADIIENNNIFTGSYVIEVCSPGVDRPIKTFEEFRRILGRKVRVFLSAKINEKIEFEGVVEDVKQECISLKTGEELVILPLQIITKAKQVIK
jgi:ribosome maturation factor RimP